MKVTRKSNGRKLIVYAVLLTVIVTLCFTTNVFDVAELKKLIKVDGRNLLRLIVMVLSVLVASNLITFIISLFKPKKHRTRSLFYLFSKA